MSTTCVSEDRTSIRQRMFLGAVDEYTIGYLRIYDTDVSTKMNLWNA